LRGEKRQLKRAWRVLKRYLSTERHAQHDYDENGTEGGVETHPLHAGPVDYPQCARNARVHHSEHRRSAGLAAGPAVEAEPPEPQQPGPERHKRPVCAAPVASHASARAAGRRQGMRPSAARAGVAIVCRTAAAAEPRATARAEEQSRARPPSMAVLSALPTGKRAGPPRR
jgi:hypothetical protein